MAEHVTEGARSVTFTVSAGVAESTPGDTVTTLVRRADEGLYQAKKRGRNRVVVQHRGRSWLQAFRPA